MVISYFKKSGKNTPAKFTEKVKIEIYDRDGGRCIICGSSNLSSPHHVLFGIEAERGKDRNNVEKGVSICNKCHHKIHHEGNVILRNFCKNYLINIY